MQLSGPEIVGRGLIQNHHERSIKVASYDLRVGRIFIEGKEYKGVARIDPQRTFIIVSEETVSIPAGVVGYAMPKTGLTKQGILAISTGLVDPGYSGRISTTAINFDRNPIDIRPGEPFLRLVFHRLEGLNSDATESYRARTDEDYFEESKLDSERFPASFLDVPTQVNAVVERVSRDILEKQRNQVLWLIGILTGFFLLWNIGASVVMNRQSTSAVERLIGVDRQLDLIQDLHSRVGVMEQLMEHQRKQFEEELDSLRAQR